MKHFDLFSGYGGFSLALEKVYGNTILGDKIRGTQSAEEREPTLRTSLCTESKQWDKPQCIGFSEIDKYASAVLEYRWPNIQNYGDITKINWAEVPDFDLLTGGSPCQDLSIAGKRAGLGGSRSGLFYEYMRAVKEKKPRYFIWENVKGALSSNNGKDFGIVINEMAQAGYSLWWQVLNAKDFGVPQNRERIFVVGFRDQSAPEIFFERGTTENNSIKVVGNLNSETWQKRNESIRRVHSVDGIAPTTPTGTGGGVMTKIAKTIRCGGGGSPFGSKQCWDSYKLDGKIRRLTPKECERLMGLPDGWTTKGIMNDQVVEISDSQRYKLCGNGVVVNVVEEIIKRLIFSN